ncbi:HAD family hydrolase [Vibrio sp. RC27]
MINTIIFDFFGTLVEYSTHRKSLQFSQTHHYLNTNIIEIEYESFVENWHKVFCKLEQQSQDSQIEFSLHDVLTEFLFFVNAKQISDDIEEGFIDLYIREWSAHIKPVPGVEALLDKLYSNYKLAIVSNTHHIKMVPMLLEKFAMSGYFTEIVTSVDHGRPKPHKSIYQVALSALQEKADNSIFIGDSYEHDYWGPQTVGIKSILISNKPPKNVPNEHVISNITSLNTIIKIT